MYGGGRGGGGGGGVGSILSCQLYNVSKTILAYLERFIETSSSSLETTPSKPAMEISTVRIRKTTTKTQLLQVLMLQVSCAVSQMSLMKSVAQAHIKL